MKYLPNNFKTKIRAEKLLINKINIFSSRNNKYKYVIININTNDLFCDISQDVLFHRFYHRYHRLSLRYLNLSY